MRNESWSIAWPALSFLLMFAAGGPPARAGDLDSEPSPRVVEAATRFGFNLYGEIAKASPGGNVFISPTSVSMALSMAANGAGGATRSAMLQAFGSGDLPIDEINLSMGALMRSLEAADPGVRLLVANSIWARKGMAFEKPFLELNRRFYDAETSVLDFLDPASPGVINAWVKEKTEGRIPSMVDRIDPQNILYLLNAVYFKGMWTEAFDRKETRDRPFTLASGTAVDVPMMSRSGRFKHLSTEGFEAVSLPYGDGRLRMYLFLPAPGGDLKGFHRTLTAEAWKDWMSRFRETQGSVSLPRFRMEYEVSMKEALSAMGMGIAFDAARADFSPMVDAREVSISQVKQKSFVEVNEEGTEAAAATSVEITLTSAVMTPFRIVFDHPFFCAIRDDRTGAVLFMGAVNDPR